jgi:hypothetical protein
MNVEELLDGLNIPPRTSNHRGEWCALYLEPLPGSGERLCIGVVGVDGTMSKTLPVTTLSGLYPAFGKASSSFEWAARLAILEVRSIAENRGLDPLVEEMQSFEGFCVGERRMGAGHDLEDLLRLSLSQSSALEVYKSGQVDAPDAAEVLRAGPVANAVKRIVVAVRPTLRENFARQYRFSDSARPTSFGFVGQRIVANFATIGGDSSQALAAQVDRAKARLWDLEQLHKGVLQDSFGAPMRQVSFELLACPPAPNIKTIQPRKPVNASQILEAAQTLEREADKFDIRWRLLRNPQELAHSILTREAA